MQVVAIQPVFFVYLSLLCYSRRRRFVVFGCVSRATTSSCAFAYYLLDIVYHSPKTKSPSQKWEGDFVIKSRRLTTILV